MNAIWFQRDRVKRSENHPTQKPLDLLKHIVKTHSNTGDTVLDFVMGSGSTGVASVELQRSFVGIEKEKKYFDMASKKLGQEDPDTSDVSDDEV